MRKPELATDPDRYRTLDEGPEVEIEIKIKGSRFLGCAFSIDSVDSAAARLAALRRRYHDATHHCSAWRLGRPEDAQERFDDDGEPSGSAGAPILAAIRGAGLVDALCVVTRYFGGTKLGTGGLVRAYGEAAREALSAAPQRWVERVETLRIALPYDALGALEATLSREGAFLRGVERKFEPEPELVLTVLSSRSESLVEALVEATAGRARVSRESESCGPGGSS